MYSESPYTMIYGEIYSKNIEENFVLNSPVFCPNTEEHGANNPVIAMALCIPSYLLIRFDLFL